MAVGWAGIIGAPGRLTRMRAVVADRALTLTSGRAAAADAQVDNGGVGVMIRTARATFSGEASAAATAAAAVAADAEAGARVARGAAWARAVAALINAAWGAETPAVRAADVPRA